MASLPPPLPVVTTSTTPPPVAMATSTSGNSLASSGSIGNGFGTLYELQSNDRLTLIEELDDSWWVVDINGRRARVLIADVRVKRHSKKNLANSGSLTSSAEFSSQRISPPPTISTPPIVIDQAPGNPTETTPKKVSRFDERRKRRRSQNRDTLRSKASRANFAMDLNELSTDLLQLKIDIDLLIKAFEQDSNVKMVDSRMVVKEPAGEKILAKMLEYPYQALFKLNGKETTTNSIDLAPPKIFFLKSLLLPPHNLNAVSSDLKAKLRTLDFNVLEFRDTNQELMMQTLLITMFYELDLVARFRIPEITLARFVTLVASRYREVPFHNFYHASNVAQTLYFFLTTAQASAILGPLEILAMLIAALCHDLDHPGLNNDFQRKAQTRVAHFHKKSILENHHHLQCLAILSKNETNILINLNEKDEETVYSYLRDLILATDLAIHGIILKNLTERKKLLNRIWKSAQPSQLTDEDRKLVMCSLLKCADLSSEIRKNEVSKRWAKAVNEEFLKQGEKEKALDLPLTPFMDKDRLILSKEEVNFIDKLCAPLYSQLVHVFPGIQACCDNLDDNREVWNSRLNSWGTDPEQLKRLSNRSVWENNQVKVKSSDRGLSLSSTLNSLASSTNVPKPLKNSLKNSLHLGGGSAASASASLHVTSSTTAPPSGMTSSTSLNSIASSLTVPKK